MFSDGLFVNISSAAAARARGRLGGVGATRVGCFTRLTQWAASPLAVSQKVMWACVAPCAFLAARRRLFAAALGTPVALEFFAGALAAAGCELGRW